MDLSKLETLREMMIHGKEFADAMEFFLDHFGENREFMEIGSATSDPVAAASVAAVVSQIMGRTIPVTPLLIKVPGTTFIHGSIQAAGVMGMFFYFTDSQMGIAAVTAPKLKGGTMFSRFSGMRVVEPADPRRN